MSKNYFVEILCTDGHENFIAHGVNCRNKMGSGVAKAIFTEYPEVKEEYHKFWNEKAHLEGWSGENFLGVVQQVSVHDGKIVFNMFTQLNYGYDGKLYVDYNAIKKCFDYLVENCYYVKKIAIPKIGCGLAGGEWEIVKEIINESTKDKIEVYVYYM